MENKAIFITVRTGSSRLPNKAILKINGKTTIEYVIDSVKRSKYADLVVLCTTTLQEDKVLCDIAAANGIDFFQGSEENKWERWKGACNKYDVDFFVNADGDDLFYDAGLADCCFRQYNDSQKQGIVIDGQGFYNDVYGICRDSIIRICDLEKSEKIEPHNLTNFLKTSNLGIERLRDVPDIYAKRGVRMTLDYAEDLRFFETVIQHFKTANLEMTFDGILDYLEKNPDVVEINWFREQEWEGNQRRMISRRAL